MSSPMARKNTKAGGSRDAAKEATRLQLIDAAMLAFGEQGFDAPSLDSICERAGLTRGAFYVHFQDRDELIAAVMGRFNGALHHLMIAREGEPLDLQRVIRFFVDAVEGGLYPPRTGAVRLHHVLDAAARSQVILAQRATMQGQAVALLTEAARVAQVSGRIRDDVTPSSLGTLLLALATGIETMQELGYTPAVRSAGEALLRLLEPPPRARAPPKRSRPGR
ncbi:MAG: TetR family transcriptional regulator [Myxococcales bacterium]|nr:TetR family transcriptional regulator [Myxococcales bacterium]